MRRGDISCKIPRGGVVVIRGVVVASVLRPEVLKRDTVDISVRWNVLAYSASSVFTDAESHETYAECGSWLCVDVVLRLERLAGKESPRLVDTLGQVLSLVLRV
jgi:hypothetical protein